MVEPSLPTDLREDPELVAVAQKVEAVLHEAVQDLGLSVDISLRPSRSARRSEDTELTRATREHWLIAPRLERRSGALWLRLTVVAPRSRVLHVAYDVLDPEDVEMRVVVMLRDVMTAARPGERTREPNLHPNAPEAEPAARTRSEGRGILALNAALFGGFVGFSLQRASGSEDERLIYPLAALGAGVGLGGSMLVAEEWDIGVGDAWFLASGLWWPIVSGSFLAHGYKAPAQDRYAYGLLGATAGVTVASGALSFFRVNDGGALLAHSGGAFGTLLGGLVELAGRGRTDVTPYRGIGYGSGIGVLVAGALATQTTLPPGRVLMTDLGATLGALAGAAIGSPLLLVEESAGTSSTRNRLWLGSVGMGTLIGGAIGFWSSRPSSPGFALASSGAPSSLRPGVGCIAVTERGAAYGATLSGTW
ncbi:MAG TPA: hypothetical protein VFQ61_35020 [Polyangiaceae bacterium]|nr:hypothetical protein [Polyangiaceae bacterium]